MNEPETPKKVSPTPSGTPDKQPQQIPRPKTVIDLIFSLGNKLSPDRKLDFTYYLLWILFTAFVGMFLVNVWNVINGD